jgi:hypothetical protein
LLQDHRKVATIGVQCRACDHKQHWPIEELIVEYKSPDHGRRAVAPVEVLQVRIARRAPFAIGR